MEVQDLTVSPDEHYALWEVIKFGDSYKAPQEEAASESSVKKKGRTIVITTEDMQGRSIKIGKEAEVERITDGLFPTVSAIFTTASVVTPYSRRLRGISAKDKEEEIAREDQKMNEQLARDAEIARLHAEEELQKMIDGLDRNNEKQIEDFVPMSSTEEAQRVKKKGLKLEQGSTKRMKTSEDMSKEDLKEMMQLVPVKEALVKETLSIRQATKDKEKELWVELKRLFEPDFENQLWTHNQKLMNDPLYWKLYDTCGVHHVFTKDHDIFMLVVRDYPLRRGLAIVMITNKLQVENYS
uniref:Uncharacterized protein n=1 Tax=Tanacetum cinerariifolium TaxID=118510 RepID=A0A6L2N3K5_TANCI|nr:hypothetical protein [Tanacetum cinerariifolium]